MTFEVDDQPGGPGWKVECALTVYRSMGRALKNRILLLESAEPSDALAKAVADELRTHQKALLQLLEYEAKVDGRSATDGSGAGAPLDLDAARDELRARISKLRERRGNRGVAGKPE